MTVGIDLFQVAFLSNFGAGDDAEAISNPRAKDPDGHWKNDCAEVIASDCGGDTVHCYAAFTETDALLGKCGGGDAAHWKNDCAEVIASHCGGDITHCYAAFTETDSLVGAGGGGDAAHWKNDCAEVIASDCGGDIPNCHAALIETDAVLRERGGRDETPSKNACSEVRTSVCGAHMTHCSDAHRQHDPAHWKNIHAGTFACGVRDHAAFIETNHSTGKPVSSRMSDSPENAASRSLSTPIEGRRDEWRLCFTLLQTASAVMEQVLCNDGGLISPEIISSCSAGNVEAFGSVKYVAALLNTVLEQFLEQSALCLKLHPPTDCGASALRSHAESPGPVAALGSLP